MKLSEPHYIWGSSSYIRYGKKHGYSIELYYSSYEGIYYFVLRKSGKVFDSRYDNQLTFISEKDCIEACMYCINTNMMFEKDKSWYSCR